VKELGSSSWVQSAAVLSLALVTACAGGAVRDRYAHDFGCYPESVRETSPETYDAEGCGGVAAYRCERGDCYPVAGSGIRRESASGPASTRKRAKRGAHRKKNHDGQMTVVLVTVLDGGFRFMLETDPTVAEPGARARVLGPSTRFEGLDDCELEWMINDERIRAPQSKFETQGSLTALGTWLPPDFIGELGVAGQVALKICDRRFSLSAAGLEDVRGFVALYQEEQAWAGEAGEGTRGMMAPAGGWPDWSALGDMPEAQEGASLSGEVLYERLAPSVFQVQASLASGAAQGSAVAVSENQLLTNCHVVAGAGKIVVRQGKQEHSAKIVRSSPKTDRCVLEVKGPKLKVIPGVRSYDDLKVGESVYTLGSPGGLELSLSQGVLSGLREPEDGRHYVQTTAPISPGSSGGGLFDARGNLIGITTLVYVGRKRLNQALNFAIPAETFYQP
jgi:hypothetical protein